MFQEKRYVYEVYRQRSFSRAAKALYISQPSLSLMVRKAEERIGSPLFDRSTSPIGLTEAGRMYIRAVEQVMEIENSFQEYLDDAENCLTGVLSLGGTTFFASTSFRRSYRPFRPATRGWKSGCTRRTRRCSCEICRRARWI